jgi:hypothetical protein
VSFTAILQRFSSVTARHGGTDVDSLPKARASTLCETVMKDSGVVKSVEAAGRSPGIDLAI